MASSAQRHKRHTDVDWLQHRHFIQEMYIDRNKTLQDVVKSLADLGFNVTSVSCFTSTASVTLTPYSKSQLEYKTKIWGFTKKLKRGSSKSTWQYIGHRVAQRKRQGKQSRVEINGSIIGNTKIASETRRYEPKSCAYDYQGQFLDISIYRQYSNIKQQCRAPKPPKEPRFVYRHLRTLGS
jgi:hypothetical protein